MKLRQWLSYVLVLPSFAKIEGEQTADSLIAFSFGRNSLLDDQVNEIKAIRQRNNNNLSRTLADLRETLKIDPGEPNLEIAQARQKLVEDNPNLLYLIVQWEIALSFESEWLKQHYDIVYCIWPGQYNPTSLEVAGKARSFMSKMALERPIIVAHGKHLARCYFIFAKLFGKECLAVAGSSKFDKKSVQPRTRNLFYWVTTEMLTRLILFLIKIKK